MKASCRALCARGAVQSCDVWARCLPFQLRNEGHHWRVSCTRQKVGLRYTVCPSAAWTSDLLGYPLHFCVGLHSWPHAISLSTTPVRLPQPPDTLNTHPPTSLHLAHSPGLEAARPSYRIGLFVTQTRIRAGLMDAEVLRAVYVPAGGTAGREEVDCVTRCAGGANGEDGLGGWVAGHA